MEENNSAIGNIALVYDGNDSESQVWEHWLLEKVE